MIPDDSDPSERRPADHQTAGTASSAPLGWIALGVFCAASFFLYREAFSGPFFSDDLNNIANNEYIQRPSADNWIEIWRPTGAPAKLTQNYAPLHMLVHSAQWQVLGDQVTGYHVVNALLHGVASFLLALLLARSGVQRWVALVGGAFFLVHPANVEAVAWIYQLKTSLSLILALLALLAFQSRPGWGAVAFVAALLTKVTAAFALPVALATWWTSGPAGRREAPEALALFHGDTHKHAVNRTHALAWLGVWALCFVAFAISAFGIFASTNANVPPLHSDPLVVARTLVAIAGRYLAMAATSYGVSAFQEVALADNWTNPWWLASLLALALLAWRCVFALLRRKPEGPFWIWAACSFAPVSQLFPFLHPMADRYLYFMLPGLIGAVLLASQDLLAQRLTRGPAKPLRWAAIAVACALLVFMTARSVERVRLWRYPVLLQNDAAQRYPDGLLANNLRARQAALAGDAETAFAALRVTVERGDLRFRELLGDPAWAWLHGDQRFQAIVADIAQRWLDLRHVYESPSQPELYGFSEAAALLMQYDLAEQLLIEALEVGGIRDDLVRAQLARVREARDEAAQPKELGAPR